MKARVQNAGITGALPNVRLRAVALEAIVVAIPYVIAGYDHRVTASVVPVIVVISLLYLRARSLPAAVLGGFLHDFVGFIVMSRLM